LSERDGVARSTGTLVTDWSGEIETINVGEVIRLWQLAIWNFVGGLVLFGPALNLLEGLFEFRRVVSEFWLWLGNLLSKSGGIGGGGGIGIGIRLLLIFP
jgi:hypothetical protein